MMWIIPEEAKRRRFAQSQEQRRIHYAFLSHGDSHPAPDQDVVLLKHLLNAPPPCNSDRPSK